MPRSVLLLSTLLALDRVERRWLRTRATASCGWSARAQRPRPAGFVIDAVISKGYEPLQSQVSGWFSALPPDAASDDISGSCIEDRCVLNVDLEDGKLSLTGDFAKAGATAFQGRAILSESYGDTPKGEAPATYTSSWATTFPASAGWRPTGAVGEHELAALAVWAGATYGFNYTDDGPPGDMERDALGQWQAGGRAAGPGPDPGRPARRPARRGGRREGQGALDARRGQGLEGGLSRRPAVAGGPRPLRLGRRQGEHRLFGVGAGRRRRLGRAVDEAHAEDDGRDVQGYTRVNDDMEVTMLEGGTRTFVVLHRRKGGVAKMVLTYPNEAPGGLDAYEAILPREFMVTDEVAP